MIKKKIILLLICSLLLSACEERPSQPEADIPKTAEPSTALNSTQESSVVEGTEISQADVKETGVMKLLIGDLEVSVQWENNESVEALRELVEAKPLTISMSMYGGFEQVGSIGTSLPRRDAQTVTEAGDIVLYSGNQIVIFYGSNSWAYTRLGHVDLSAAEMSDLFSQGDVTITLSLK